MPGIQAAMRLFDRSMHVACLYYVQVHAVRHLPSKVCWHLVMYISEHSLRASELDQNLLAKHCLHKWQQPSLPHVCPTN